MDRCEEHNGFDCCGMNGKGCIDPIGVTIDRTEVENGSICTNLNDKELIEKYRL